MSKTHIVLTKSNGWGQSAPHIKRPRQAIEEPILVAINAIIQVKPLVVYRLNDDSVPKVGRPRRDETHPVTLGQVYLKGNDDSPEFLCEEGPEIVHEIIKYAQKR